MAAPTLAAPVVDIGSCTGGDVVKCSEGYGHLVYHYNMHYVDKGYEPGKFDIYIQGQLLLNPEYGKTEVYKLNLKLVVNGQAGEVGVMNGQVKFKCGDCDFHLIAHYSNGEGWCKVVPVEPV